MINEERCARKAIESRSHSQNKMSRPDTMVTALSLKGGNENEF